LKAKKAEPKLGSAFSLLIPLHIEQKGFEVKDEIGKTNQS
jgi:hypothetical protein